MKEETKNLIKRRARSLELCCERILNHEDNECQTSGTGFRWSYLILRRPRRFLEAFRNSDLSIDPDLLEECIWMHQRHLEGPNGLMLEERATLERHNLEVAALADNRAFPMKHFIQPTLP